MIVPTARLAYEVIMEERKKRREWKNNILVRDIVLV
jgi:hypothetical protein